MALENFYEYFMETCQGCGQEKSIPIIRTVRKCDECLETEFEAQVNSEKKIEADQRMEFQRIPKLFRNFDITKLEIAWDEFKELCKPGQSLAISGEVGTGKSNLACQILIHRKAGTYIPAAQLFKFNLDKVADMNLICIDDLTKIDSTDNKKMEKLFELLNHRYSESKDTIFTLDKKYSEIERQFGDYGLAIISRLRAWLLPVVLIKKWR